MLQKLLVDEPSAQSKFATFFFRFFLVSPTNRLPAGPHFVPLDTAKSYINLGGEPEALAYLGAILTGELHFPSAPLLRFFQDGPSTLGNPVTTTPARNFAKFFSNDFPQFCTGTPNEIFARSAILKRLTFWTTSTKAGTMLSSIKRTQTLTFVLRAAANTVHSAGQLAEASANE